MDDRRHRPDDADALGDGGSRRDHFEEGEEAPPPGVATMAIVRWVLLALVALAAVLSLWNYARPRPRPNAPGSHDAAPSAPAEGDRCASEFDGSKYPAKLADCRKCAVHRGMGSMEQDCVDAIPKPWR